MQSVRSISLFSLSALVALPMLAATAIAQPPIVRTKPVIEQQQQMAAMKHAKQMHQKGHSDHYGYGKSTEAKRQHYVR